MPSLSNIQRLLGWPLFILAPKKMASRLEDGLSERLEKAPTVSLSRDKVSNLILEHSRQRVKVHWVLLSLLIMYTAALIATSSALSGKPNDLLIAFSIIIVITYALMFGAIIFLHKRSSNLVCMVGLLIAAINIESAPQRWNDVKYRLKEARRIEGAAKALERLPLTYTGISTRNRLELIQLARVKAAGLRELEIWLIRPEGSTFTDVVFRLVSDLRKLMNARWFDLPDGTPPPAKISARNRLTLTAAGLLAFSAMAATIVFSARVGGVAAFLTTAFGIAGVTLLRTGLGMARSDSYVDQEKQPSATAE
jgi:hypothetical protein